MEPNENEDHFDIMFSGTLYENSLKGHQRTKHAIVSRSGLAKKIQEKVTGI